MVVLKRKLYRRGSSYETTIPLPMLFSLDLSRKHDVMFDFDRQTNRWFVSFVESGENKEERPRVVIRKKKRYSG